MNPIGDDDFLKNLQLRAEEMAHRFEVAKQTLPCHFDGARIADCSDECEAKCVWRRERDCPKFVRAEDVKLRADAQASARARALANGVSERTLRRVFDERAALTPAMSAVREFMKGDKSILVLSGTNACGKTTAAAWACLPPEDADWFGSAPAFTGRFARLVDLEAAGRFSELLQELRQAPLVVLDDIGAAHFGASGWLASMVDDLVDAVYQSCHKIILTTDLAVMPDLKDPDRPCLARLLSRRVMSRIKDAGMVVTKLGDRYVG